MKYIQTWSVEMLEYIWERATQKSIISHWVTKKKKNVHVSTTCRIVTSEQIGGHFTHKRTQYKKHKTDFLQADPSTQKSMLFLGVDQNPPGIFDVGLSTLLEDRIVLGLAKTVDELLLYAAHHPLPLPLVHLILGNVLLFHPGRGAGRAELCNLRGATQFLVLLRALLVLLTRSQVYDHTEHKKHRTKFHDFGIFTSKNVIKEYANTESLDCPTFGR